jgi:hypothetical protein
MEYYKNGSTSPINASHSVFAFQQVVDDAEMYGCARNTTIVSDVAIPRIALVVEGGDASITEIDGLKMLPAGGLATTMITECIMEVNAAEVLAKSTTTRTVVTNVDAPNTNPVIGYRGYVGSTATDFTSKWSVKVDNCATSLAITGDATRAISDIANNRIKAWQSFEIGDNPGYRNWYRAMAICIKRIKAGTKMSVLLDDCTFVDTDYTTTVTVPWGTSGTLALKGDGVSNTNTTANDAVVVAYFDGASPNSWFTLDGGLNWRTGN